MLTWLARIAPRRPPGPPASRSWSGFVAGVRARQGVAAVEFSLLLPAIFMLYVGAAELANAAMTSRRVEELSRTLADLVAQQPTSGQTSSTPAPANATTQLNLQSILQASSAILAPSSLTPLAMTISAVDIVNASNGRCCAFTVRWSYTQNGTLRPCNTPLTPVPPQQAPSPGTVSNAMLPPLPGYPLPYPVPIIIADVSYAYSGLLSSPWLGFPTMQRTSYMLPRSSGQVIVAGPLPTGTSQSGSICY